MIVQIETLTKMFRLTEEWNNKITEGYSTWCKGVVDLAFSLVDNKERVLIHILQSVERRPALEPFITKVETETGVELDIVVLNISMSAVRNFVIEDTGLSFECMLGDHALYDHFTYGEILHIAVMDDGATLFSSSFNPSQEYQSPTMQIFNTNPPPKINTVESPVVSTEGNVIVGNFGKSRGKQ